MNDELRLIQHLYGEAKAPEALEDDPVLRDEHEQLRRVRDVLDARPRSRPSPGVLDRVMQAASEGAAEGASASSRSEAEPALDLPRGRQDRAPALPPSQRWTRLLSVGGALALALLLVIVGHDQIVEEGAVWNERSPDQAAVEAQDAEPTTRGAAPSLAAAPEAAEARDEASGLAETEAQAGADKVPPPASGEAVPEELLAWDTPREEVFEAYRRMQVLEARSHTEGLSAASTRRPHYD